MKNRYGLNFSLLLFVILSYSNVSQAQRLYFAKPNQEVAGGVGLSVFRGDIGGTNELSSLANIIDFSTFGFSCQFGYRQTMKHGFSLRSELNYSFLKADDAFSESKTRRARNLQFRTSVYEFSAGGEYSLLHAFKSLQARSSFEFYVMGGASVYYFNPKAAYKSSYVALQPLGTEGQGYNGVPLYSRWSYAMVGGIGYRRFLANNITLGVEISLKAAFTDYLDDVSNTYAVGDELLEQNGNVAYELSYRGKGEYPDKQLRGNPDLNDNFGALLFTFSKALSSRPHVFTKKK